VVSGCSGGDDGGSPQARDESSTTTSAVSTSSASTTTTAPKRVDPNSVLVARGYLFGSAPPSLAATRDVYRADDLVLGSEVAVAWHASRVQRIADVIVLSLDGPALVDDQVVQAYVDAFEGALARTGSRSVSFLHRNLLVVLVGPDRAAVTALRDAMTTAIAAGAEGGPTRHTPMRRVAPGSVFVELPNAIFEPYPTPSDTTVEGTPTTEEPGDPPAAPTLDDANAVSSVELRRVLVGNEARALAWALGTRTDVVRSAEELEILLERSVRSRVRADVTTRAVSDRSVWVATGIRGFRVHNVVVIVEGADEVQLDSLVASWLQTFSE
jgi:hypothetical protein